MRRSNAGKNAQSNFWTIISSESTEVMAGFCNIEVNFARLSADVINLHRTRR